MNLRECITRTVTYTKVTITTDNEQLTNIVYGKTTQAKVMKEWLKENEVIPTIDIEVKTEKRAIEIGKFILNSEIINNEGEEN